tara:strand:+ start:167 stop:895 length:729 start_codon:yes stop_codon:yes gene_type:complete
LEIIAHKTNSIYSGILAAKKQNEKLFAVLIDPEDFDLETTEEFFGQLPSSTTHIFIGGSTASGLETAQVVAAVKAITALPVILFPGDYKQITTQADGILFLSLISGRNPEYLIEQQIKSVQKLKDTGIQIIPTGYILINGGNKTAVQEVSKTTPLEPTDIDTIVNTALAGEYTGKKIIYLEAGSGALNCVPYEVIAAVKKEISIPLIVGGGIRSKLKMQEIYKAGADMIVVGNAFEKGTNKI